MSIERSNRSMQINSGLTDLESSYQALIEATSLVVWEVNESGDFCGDLHSWCSYTGQRPADVENYGWVKAVSKELRSACKEAWIDGVKSQEAFHFKTKIWSHVDKAYHFVRIDAALKKTASQTKLKWVCALMDIDVEKRFNDKFRFAIQVAPYSVLIIDKYGKIAFANESTLQLSGYKQQELLDKPVEVLIPEVSRERHARYRELYMKQPVARVMGTGIATFIETKSAQQILVEVRLFPIHTERGLQIFCSMEDITLRAKAEEALQRHTEELELRVFQRTEDLLDANERLSESRERYALLYENAPDMYASISAKDTSILQCNITLVNALGYKSKSEIIGRSIFDFYTNGSKQIAREVFQKFKDIGQVDNVELSLIKKDGSILPVMLKVSAVKDKNGKIIYSISSWRDISVQKALEKEQRMTLELDLINRSTNIFNSESVFSLALEECLDMICRVVNFPVGHAYVLDDDKQSLISAKVWSLSHPRKYNCFKKITEKLSFKKGKGLPGRIWLKERSDWVLDITKDDNFDRVKICKKLNFNFAIGFPLIVESQVIAVCEFFSFDSKRANADLLEILQVVGEQVGGVLQRQNVEQRLNSLTNFDVLTNLPNRTHFNEILYGHMKRAKDNNTPLALLYLDLDNFKDVNDTLGHSIGDKLLREVSLEMRNLIKGSYAIGRIGGDEFAIIMDDIKSYADSADLAELILQKLTKAFFVDGHEINSSVSIGIATYPESGATAENLLKNADMAMYSAKDSGKSSFKFYSAELNEAYQRRALIERHLYHVIEKQELYLVYQPQICIKSGKLYGFEALVRWNNPVLGEVTPGEFIPIAEDIGLISSIGEWVLEDSFKQYREWKKKYKKDFKENPLTLAVNASVVQLMQESIVKHVQRLMRKYGIKPHKLTIEVTESSLMLNLERSIKALNELHRQGVVIAIDDFGTGYSSLSYLKHLPFSFLKIDQSFVQDIMQDSNDASIIKAIIQLGVVMDLEVLAEGVETKEQLQFLQIVGCNYVQGFYFSKPLLPKDAEKIIIKRNMF